MKMARVAVSCGLLACVFALAMSPQTASAQAQEIQDFVELEPKWDDLVGISFHVEGRYSIYGKDLLYFANCSMPFRSEEPLPKLTGDGRHIAVYGKLGERMGRVYFAVSRVVQLPDDFDRLRQKRAAAKPGDAVALYDIAEWAARRARFYGDDPLLDAAHATYEEGLQIEARVLVNPTAEQMASLAAKAANWKLPSRIQLEYRHESLQLRWSDLEGRDLSQSRVAEERALAERILRDLPGADVPDASEANESPPVEPAPITPQQYARAPRAVYLAADDSQRARLHRWFYQDVVLQRIWGESRLEKWDGLKTARAIEAALPDCAKIAEQHRSNELMARLQRAAEMNRNQVVELAEQFRQRDQRAFAEQALEAWIERQTERERREGPAGLLRLAREYEMLLGNKSKAAELLVEAYGQVPDSAEVTRRLKELGFTRREGEWLAADDPRADVTDPIARAMREGRVERGMTYEQVKSTLGAPGSVVRIASSGEVTEIWLYGTSGSSRLAVYFQRSTRRGLGSAEVVLISQLPAGT